MRKRYLPCLAVLAPLLMPISTSAQTGYAQVTMANQTSISIDLHVRGLYGCRTLGGGMCTTQAQAGANISIIGKDMNGNVVVTGTIEQLNSGDSFTWTITE